MYPGGAAPYSLFVMGLGPGSSVNIGEKLNGFWIPFEHTVSSLLVSRDRETSRPFSSHAEAFAEQYYSFDKGEALKLRNWNRSKRHLGNSGSGLLEKIFHTNT
jgi:hypothetical protein